MLSVDRQELAEDQGWIVTIFVGSDASPITKKALLQLQSAVELSAQRALSNLEKQGAIQAFEFTHELAWNVLKDFLQDQGNQNVKGSKDATREAFKVALIADGEA